jgi:simple sugar transport system ATP-binding protein
VRSVRFICTSSTAFKTREEIADLMAGGAAIAELEAEIEEYMETHDGRPPQVAG